MGILIARGHVCGDRQYVILPALHPGDAAALLLAHEGVRLQANVENLFDTKYYINADSNTNISPGFPRAIRVALVAGF